ncbi:MAG: FAD binding domain-containing protein [Conexivisphaera sp.]
MVPKQFEYYAPPTIEEALSLLDRYGDEAKIIAGGQSLVPLMKFRFAAPTALVDIYKHIRNNLSYIREDHDGTVSIGALTTHHEIVSSELCGKYCPMLVKAAGNIGDWQVRNRGTIGGSACHADPAAHYLPALMALGAQFLVRGPHGDRIIDVKDFFKGPFTTAVKPNEILVEIRVPKRDGAKWGYEFVQRRSGDFAVAIAAVSLDTKGSTIRSARIIVGAVTPMPVEMERAEALLAGQKLNADLIKKASAIVYDEITNPMADFKASPEYKRQVAATMVERALLSAMGGV